MGDRPLAALPTVGLEDETGFAAEPAYRGVRINVRADGPSSEQLREGPDWGSFPQDFVNFQVDTGQAAYWYSSGGIRDAAKPASTVYVSYDAEHTTPPSGPPPSSGGDTDGGGVLPPLGGPIGLGPSAGLDGFGQHLAPGGMNTGSAGPVPPGIGPGLAGTAPGGPEQVAPGVLEGADDLEAGAGRPALATQATWPTSGLIPEFVAQAWDDPRTRAVLAMGGLFGVGSLAIVGFRRGWFVWPWSGTAGGG